MDRAQVIEELKALKEAFEEERDAYPICLEEAIRHPIAHRSQA